MHQRNRTQIYFYMRKNQKKMGRNSTHVWFFRGTTGDSEKQRNNESKREEFEEKEMHNTT